jgi:hypothetical protein
LELPYRGPQENLIFIFANTPEAKAIRTEANILRTMYYWLCHLSGTSSRTFGTLGIARAVLFLWKKHFARSPLYKEVTLLLLERGSQQEGWFPAIGHHAVGTNELQLVESLSRLQVAGTSTAGPMSSAEREGNLETIYHLNMRARELVSMVLSTLGHVEEPLKDSQEATMDLRLYHELAEVVERHNLLIHESLRDPSMFDIMKTLRISGLVIQCDFLVRIIKIEGYANEEPRDTRENDFIRFSAYLEQLKAAFEG